MSDTRLRAAGSSGTVLGRASIFVKIALLLIIVILVVMSVKLLMDYSELLKEKEQLQNRLDEVYDKIEELQYYIDSPMDEAYVRKFAKELLGLVSPDEIVYIAD